MNITTLDIATFTNNVIDTNEQAILNAIEDDKQHDSKLEQSKVIARVKMEIEKEIRRQGAIYVDEENKAIKFVQVSHQATKTAWTEANEILAALKKRYDESKARRLEQIEKAITETAEKCAQLKRDMVGHQGFRGALCREQKAKPLLSERVFNELNSVYLGFREPPMKEYMALADLWTKIQEHAKRVQQIASLLPALAKETQSDETVINAIAADLETVTKLKERMALDVPGKAGNLKSMATTLANHKKVPCRPDYVKMCATTLGDHEKKIKAHYSEIKTCQLMADTAKKKADHLAKDTDVKAKIKKIEEAVKEMNELIDEWEKQSKKADDERKKVAAILKVA